ncbi:MAG: hypothetical protein ACOVOQ_00615 [Flavobacterium sp.]
MKNSTLIVLGLLGVGVYLYLRNRNLNQPYFSTASNPETPNPAAINPAAPVNNTGVPANIDSFGKELPQTLDAKNYLSSYNIRYAIAGNKKIGKIPNTI